MTKVFGIGFHKTGTSSLAKALERLGYTVCGARRDLVEPAVSNDLDKLFKVIDQYDACQDNPWPILFRELDEHYPGSKFILIERDPDKWLRSAIRSILPTVWFNRHLNTSPRKAIATAWPPAGTRWAKTSDFVVTSTLLG